MIKTWMDNHLVSDSKSINVQNALQGMTRNVRLHLVLLTLHGKTNRIGDFKYNVMCSDWEGHEFMTLMVIS